MLHTFPSLEPVCCSMSSSQCCFLTCIQIFQEACKVVWFFHLLKNFPQFLVIHTVKGFGIVNKTEVSTIRVSHRILSCVRAKSLQSSPTLRPFGLRPTRLFSAYRMLQARLSEWVAMPSSKGSSRHRDRTLHLLCLLHWPMGSSPLSHLGRILSVP